MTAATADCPAAATVPTPEEVLSWPVTVPVPQAGRCYGLGRDASYQAARAGELPVATRVGRRWIVVVAHLRAALGIDQDASHARANGHDRANRANGSGAGPPGPAHTLIETAATPPQRTESSYAG